MESKGQRALSEVRAGEWVEVLTSERYEWKQVLTATTSKAPPFTVLALADGSTVSGHPSSLQVVVADAEGVPNAVVVPEWDSYFLALAQAIALRAKCRRRQVGALLVSCDRRVLSTGYNGFPSGSPNDCLSGGCPRGLSKRGEIAPDSSYTDPGAPGFCPALHAEANALLFLQGSDAKGATLYVTDRPCPDCTRLIAGAGVIRVVWPGGELDPMDFYRSAGRG